VQSHQSTSSKGNSFAPIRETTLSTVEGNSYQWSKAGITTVLLYKLIKLLKLGKYAVKVDFGGCQANASIELKEFIINSTRCS
jgi:hypothetical protein